MTTLEAPMNVFYDLLDKELFADRDEMSRFVHTFTILQNFLSTVRIPDSDTARLQALMEEMFVSSDNVDFMVRYQAFLILIDHIPNKVSLCILKKWIKCIMENEWDDGHIHMLIKICFNRSCADQEVATQLGVIHCVDDWVNKRAHLYN